MRYPTAGAYQEAVQDPGSAFRDPELQAATPEENALGLPLAVTGAFAVVFPLARPGRRYAVKCFLTDVRDQPARYRAVSRHLAAHPLPYLIGFDYQAEGIEVEGARLPVLKMEWVDGLPLNRFVAARRTEPGVLEALAEAWRVMLEALAAAGIAHGDLQHGNVLVVPDGDGWGLRLVDYDTMYVPALRGHKSPEVGHRNYQHPDRDEGDTGPALDHFSGLVVYTALRACSLDPALWDRFDTGENLLFRADDFFDPARSPLFDALSGLAPLRPLVAALRTACLLEPEAVPPLSDVLSAGAAPATGARRARRRRLDEGRREAFERWFAPVVVAGLALGGGLAAAGLAGAGGSLLAALAGLAVWGSLHRYHRLPATRRRYRLRREAQYFERVLAGLRQQSEALAHERDAYVAGRAALHDRRLHEVQAAALEAGLKHHFIDQLVEGGWVPHKVVVRLKAAGIRTAALATPERVAAVRELSAASRAQVAAWREGLVSRYAAAVPAALSAAELRRLERLTQQRLDALDAERLRVQEKLAAQRAEQAQVTARLDGVSALTYGRYLRYLFYFAPLPEAAWPAPSPAASPMAPRPPARIDREPAEPRPWWREG